MHENALELEGRTVLACSCPLILHNCLFDLEVIIDLIIKSLLNLLASHHGRNVYLLAVETTPSLADLLPDLSPYL